VHYEAHRTRREKADTAAAQAAYDAQKTGDPIGDADLRATLGVPTTPEEEDKLTEQQVLMMTSPSIQARERFEESAAALPGAATPGHDEAYAKFQDDTQKATLDRDPQAYADERAALGLTTTPDDIAKFQHPTFTDILGAERQSELVGVPIEGSTLAAQHVALQDQLNKAYIDHNVDEFVKAREMQGLPTTPADIAAFNNPTPTDVLGVARQVRRTAPAAIRDRIPDTSRRRHRTVRGCRRSLRGRTDHRRSRTPTASVGPVPLVQRPLT